MQQGMFIAMDPPKHDRLKALFQRGFTPKRIAEHEDEIRAITIEVLDRLEGRETADLVTEVAQPVVARVIGSFMGIDPADDEIWARLMNTTLGAGDPDLNPEGPEIVMQRDIPEIFERCQKLIAERRANPTDDLTSVLVHAEFDGQGLEDHEIVMGFFLLMAAGNDSTKSTYCSGMRALIENPDQQQLVLDDPSLIPRAVEESLRMFPAFAHFRRTATKDTELCGQRIAEGDKVVMWYVSSNRDETRHEDPDRFDIMRDEEHQAFGAGGRHFCLGTALARMELRILIEETLKRYPNLEISGRAQAHGVALHQPAQDAARAACLASSSRAPAGASASRSPSGSPAPGGTSTRVSARATRPWARRSGSTSPRPRTSPHSTRRCPPGSTPSSTTRASSSAARSRGCRSTSCAASSRSTSSARRR